MEMTGSIRGRTPAPFHAEVIRELNPDDLALRRVTPVNAEPRPIQKLRYQHHRLAQMLAGGVAPGTASLQTGYSPSRISILQNDPAFRELMAHYTQHNIQINTDLQTRMAGFATDVLDELQDRLEVAPETYTNRELLEAVKVTNDRGGNSPISRSQVQVAVLSQGDIQKIKEEVKASQNGHIIEAQAITYNPGLEVGETIDGTSSNVTGEAALERESGERENV